MPDGLKLGENTLVCSDTLIKGDVTIGTGCVVHPKASIVAEQGSIVMGEHCIVEETASILWKYHSFFCKVPGINGGKLVIGSWNVFEIRARVEADRIGDHNVFEMRSIVDPGETLRECTGVVVGEGCVVGATVHVAGPDHLPDRTVLFGSSAQRRVAHDRPMSQAMQMDPLRRTLPKYHHLAKNKA